MQKIKFTKAKKIKGKRFGSTTVEIETQDVDNYNSVVAYVKGHVKWKCSGKPRNPPVLTLMRCNEIPEKDTEITLGNYDYSKDPSEEFATLSIDLQPNAKDMFWNAGDSGQ